jgi:O-acetyl-ADP-ribose deacetylase (regulator of RNase III)
MSVVFVNYRVRGQAGYATLLHRELTAHFGSGQVFIASRSIRPGDDFVNTAFDVLRRCRVMLAVIGPGWSVANDPGDWVYRELTNAFGLGLRVIPVLVEDAELPAERALPPAVAALARCQYVRLRHDSIETDIARIVGALCQIEPSLPVSAAGVAKNDHEPAARTGIFELPGASRRGCEVGVVSGSIRRVCCADIWVNSENTDMQMARHTEFCISGIIRYWGASRDAAGRITADVVADELAAKVGTGPVAPGTAISTTAGALLETNNVRHVIHVASVRGEPGAGFRQVRYISWCVTSALAEADRLAAADERVRSILFPLLGTGVAGAAIEPTAATMVAAVTDYLDAHPDTRLQAVYFLAYREVELAAFVRHQGRVP